MVTYKVQIIHGAKCICKKWIPEIHDGKGKFPDLTECPKCKSQWRAKDLIEPPLNGKIKEKIFDSESLFISRTEYAMEKMKMDKEKANQYAIMIVMKQQKIFEEKYSIPVGVQSTLG